MSHNLLVHKHNHKSHYVTAVFPLTKSACAHHQSDSRLSIPEVICILSSSALSQLERAWDSHCRQNGRPVWAHVSRCLTVSQPPSPAHLLFYHAWEDGICNPAFHTHTNRSEWTDWFIQMRFGLEQVHQIWLAILPEYCLLRMKCWWMFLSFLIASCAFTACRLTFLIMP